MFILFLEMWNLGYGLVLDLPEENVQLHKPKQGRMGESEGKPIMKEKLNK